MATGQGERRKSELLVELGRAQQKINTLEDFIKDRERQFHVAVNRMRLERRDSWQGGARLRRVGHADVLLRMRSSSTGSTSDESGEDLELFMKPLGEYVCLKLERVLESADSDEPIPFILRRLVSREYNVGPEGAVIGTSRDSTVCIPRDSGVCARHVAIRWVPGSTGGTSFRSLSVRRGSKLMRQDCFDGHGHFVLEDLTGGSGVFCMTYNATSLQHSAIPEDTGEKEVVKVLSPAGDQSDQSIKGQSGGDTPLEACPSSGVGGAQGEVEGEGSALHLMLGVRFVTGQLEWSITALPLEKVLTLKMFAAARKGDLNELQSILDSSKCTDVSVPCVFVTPTDGAAVFSHHSSVSIVTEQGLDVNVEYQPPSYTEDHFFNQISIRRRSSAPVSHPLSPSSPSSPSTPQPPARFLLHIAIENGDLEMAKYLLEKGADASHCAGELHQNALHLAAHANNLPLLEELLRFGGDVEVRDARHLQPLALTNNYDVRRLLLGTVLLCAAAEAGDYLEVERLLSTTSVSPNARGLRHKNALHLASARGHCKVVEFLIMNGANVNARGGSRQRTPLHYASLNNHVALAAILLEAGANEFARDLGGYTPLNLCMGGDMCKLLHKQPLSLGLAVQSGDVIAVEQMLQQLGEREGGEGRGRSTRGISSLTHPCTSPALLGTCEYEMGQLLVAHGADVNLHGGSDSWTPLFYAAMAGHEAVVEFLLSVGASTEEVDCHGNVVQERVEQAMEEIKDRLAFLEKRGRAESVVEASLHTLMPASMTRQESGTSCSVESERVWLRSRHGNLSAIVSHLTPGPEKLLKAMETRNLAEFVNLLETRVVDANVIIDKHCPSPVLVRACEEGKVEFVEALLKYGANVHPSPSGMVDQIPLLVAAGNGHTDIVQLLVQHGATVNTMSSDTLSTPLHEAATVNSLPTVEFLISAGANLSAQNVAGETPFDCTTLLEIRELLASGPYKLLVAASTGDYPAITRLVNEEGISPSHEFQHGVTALHEACEGGHTEAVQALVDLGADVNKQTHISQLSPLHLASQHNHIEVAQVLLKARARLDMKNSEGKVPFEVACTNQMRKVLVEARTVKTQPARYSRESIGSERKCMICMDNPINTILLPCGHQAFCTSCVSQITMCALDRQTIREVITVFK